MQKFRSLGFQKISQMLLEYYFLNALPFCSANYLLCLMGNKIIRSEIQKENLRYLLYTIRNYEVCLQCNRFISIIAKLILCMRTSSHFCYR